MPVNNYLKDCKYSLNNLDNYIYLYQFNEPILNFITDDGESNATATSIKGSSQRLYCNSVQYQSTTSIDNRFAFDNTLTVTLSEHSKVSHYSIIQTLLNGNWMVVFKNTYGDAFVVNAEYPVMVSYQYVINDEKTPNNLTITFRALQNVPTVNLKGSVAFSSTLCDNYCEYNISRIETLKMIDMNKATIDVDDDGFSLTEIGEGNLKTIEFNPTSMSFTDSFDGREFSQTLTFQIPFDSYRYYFHYNLLEYLDNRYYALIKTTDDNNILGGFRQGLFPSYTISTADNNNVITITLNAKYTNYSVLGSDTMSTTTNDGMFYKPVMGECVDKLYVWTLIEQYNANGVATNGYYCLSGFEDIYNDYTILGTYDKYDTRFGFKLIDYNIDCSEGCKINNLPSSIQFENSGETKCYTLDTTCSIVWEWNSTAIDFTYDEITKEMCVTSKVDEGTFSIKATTTDGTIQYATVVIGNGGITGDTTTTINITAEGQRVTVIPVKGMSNVKSLTSSLQYQVNQNGNGYEVTVPENTREETKTYTITILYKDNSIETVSIIQERIYYIITSSEETECYGQNLYYVDKKYKKYTENGELIFVENIKGNQKETDSVICLDFDEKVSGCTNCFEGFVYTLYEYKKNGSTIATRYEKTTSSCTNNATTEYVVNTEKAKCVDGTEYYVEEMYGANCNGGNNVKLYPVIERTSIVEATDSNVCDVIDPNASGGTLYRWVDTNETYCLTNTAQTNCTSSTTNTYCDGYNLFEQTTYYVDALCNGNWVQSGNTQTILKEENSTICGYVNPDTPTGDTTNGTLSFEFSGDAATYKLNGTRYTATTSPYTIEVTDLTNCDDTFNGSSSITNLISFPDTSNVTKMRYMFRRCSGLTSLDLSSFNTSNVDDMNDMFYECTKLTSLNISNFNTYKVTDMSSMFYKCMLLSTLDVSSFDTTNVDTMTNMFCYCENLISLDLSSWNTSNLKYMSWMFEECKSLQTLDVSSWDVGDHIINKSGVFTNCTSLRTLRIKQGTRDWWCDRLEEAGLSCNIIEEGGGINKGVFKVTYSAMSNNDNNGERIFKFNEIEFNTLSTGTLTTNADNTYTYEVNIYEEENISEPITQLTSLKNFFNLGTDAIIHNMPDTSNVTNMYYMYSCWTANTKLTFDPTQFNTSSLTTLGRNFYNYKVNGDYLDLRSWDVSKVTSFATASYSSIFSVCFSDTIDIRGWNFASTNSLKWLFGNFYGLEILQDLDTSNVTDMQGMFITCSAMTSLDISNFNTSACTNMSHMFQNCSGLTSLDLSNFNTSNVSKMVGIFQNCSVINSLDVSSWDISNVTSYERMFSGCVSLNNLYIKQGTRDWWCDRLKEAGLSCDIIEEGGGSTSGVTYNCEPIPIGNFSYGITENQGSENSVLVNNVSHSISGANMIPHKYLEYSYSLSDFSTSTLTSFKIESGWYEFKSFFDTSNITDMSDMFKNCYIINKCLNLSSFNTSKATNMSGMFQGYKYNIEYLYLNGWDTSQVTDMSYMFDGCGAIEIDLTGWDTSQVTDMSYMFHNCLNLSQNISDMVKDFDVSNVTNFYNMFSFLVGNGNTGSWTGNTSITSLDLSNWKVRNDVQNCDNMFNGMTNLETLNISGWDISTWDLRSFISNCSKLTTIYMYGCNQTSITNLNKYKPTKATIVY